jgi:hypothetical protein
MNFLESLRKTTAPSPGARSKEIEAFRASIRLAPILSAEEEAALQGEAVDKCAALLEAKQRRIHALWLRMTKRYIGARERARLRREIRELGGLVDEAHSLGWKPDLGPELLPLVPTHRPPMLTVRRGARSPRCRTRTTTTKTVAKSADDGPPAPPEPPRSSLSAPAGARAALQARAS